MPRYLLPCLLMLGLASPSASQCMLRDGDRLVFVGDSITEARHYAQYVVTYFSLHEPGLKLSFRNAGLSGDTAEGALGRLQKDVMDLHPTVVSVTLGINDWKYKSSEKERQAWYRQNMSTMVRRLKEANIRPVLLGPGCVDPDRRSGDGERYDAIVKSFSETVRDIARREKTAHGDLYRLMLDVQTKVKAETAGTSIIPDSIHPGTDGHAVMAYALLKALDAVGPASGLQLDAGDPMAMPDRCEIQGLHFAGDAVSFTRIDQALPAYFPPECDTVLKHLRAGDDIRHYPFRVKGLKPGGWKLSVKGMAVGRFTAEQLTAGVNLGPLPGPWADLGYRLLDSVRKHDQLYFLRWRSLANGGLPPEVEAEKRALIAKIDDVLDDMDRKRRALAKERTWEWKLEWLGTD